LQMPVVRTYVDAPYPPEALAAGLSGEVGLQVKLDATGAVLEVSVTRPAGNGFDEAAVEAVRQMTFDPARTAEGPVGVVFEFTYAFQLTTSGELQADHVVNLEGRIREMGGGHAVQGAEVSIEGTDLVTQTGPDGRFSFEGVPLGTWRLQVTDLSHEVLTKEVEVSEGKITSADLWVKRVTGGVEEVVITYSKQQPEVTQRTLSIDEVKRVPGTFGDPVKVIQTLPGAARSPFGTGLLIIRGANPEDTAVYVDGIRVPIIYHLTGTTSVLSPDAVAAVEYMPGGYGVQFGRSTAGTVNVVTKDEFKERKLVWGTDILDTQLWFEGAVGKNKQHGIAIGARRSYIDAILPSFTRNTDFQVRPVYWDYQAKWVPKLPNGQKFSLFVYGFQDIIKVTRSGDTAVGTDQDTQGDLSTTYQSHRFVLRYHKDLSDKLSFNIDPSLGVDLINLGLGQDFGLDNWNVLLQLRADLHWTPTPAVEVIPGVDFIGGPWRFEFKSAVSFADLDDPLAERDPVGFDGHGTAWSPDTYVRVNLRPFEDRQRWLISTGLRASTVTYIYGGGITFGNDVTPVNISGFEARLATRYRAFDLDGMTGIIKASTGWYSQPPQPFESIGLGVSAKLVPERAWNSSLGFEHKVSRAVSWDLDVFYRRMDRLTEFNNSFFGAGSQPFVNTGRGYAAGFELILRHAPVNKFFGWISYTFSRSFRKDGDSDRWYPFDFDQPHIFSAQGGYNLPFDIGLSAQLQVVSGNPDTKYNAGVYDVDGDFYNGFQVGAGNAERLPTFVQTSFRIDKTWTFRRWSLVTYLDLINAIRGVNPETTIYNYDYSQWAYVRGLPFIPNLGFEAKFRP
ncbi:MAG TPA: TonB family protein, partial [Myxococcota bacterium]|nr:TonB family protein [Myxococcota bacterium]